MTVTEMRIAQTESAIRVVELLIKSGKRSTQRQRDIETLAKLRAQLQELKNENDVDAGTVEAPASDKGEASDKTKYNE